MMYPLCQQTVTVYRREENGICRQVFENCFYHFTDVRKDNGGDVRYEREFLLIVPGETQWVFPGDRVLEGVGPEIGPEDWTAFLPVNVYGLSQARYAKVFRLDGEICHTEAGR